MTFLASWRLVFIIAPVALLVAYILAQRSRRKAAVRFTSVDLLASVVPRKPAWQRHLPAAALLVALVVFILAFAQPARIVRTAKQRATVVLTLDTSGSMVATDVAPTRLGAAEDAARNFVEALPPGIQLGLVSFSSSASVLVAPTSDRSTVLAAINGLQAGGGTATAAAINLSLKAISSVPVAKGGKAAPGAIVLMSDGSPNIGEGDQSPTAVGRNRVSRGQGRRSEDQHHRLRHIERDDNGPGRDHTCTGRPDSNGANSLGFRRAHLQCSDSRSAQVGVQRNRPCRRLRRSAPRDHRLVSRYRPGPGHSRRRRSAHLERAAGVGRGRP